ncbi:hypothetical protein ONS95_010579 [Cadophora gregata]|uniref:uncharacterized protein n=1 Tax=Cadophora gregata TaxID=51156 RepID=UPI0026DC6686|nr:uncharacterized protein ONS95_010579 [Cadophora gregata]KAK0122338.1 hypothetical protein ONS95_010579 [Cadophora gregata]KAK0127816.1 hypothetical protein ONS96_007319 [Cadophora gregata f. sp. sojae]
MVCSKSQQLPSFRVFKVDDFNWLIKSILGHGNFYDGNSVCCPDLNFKCTVGQLCGACNTDSICGNNGVYLIKNTPSPSQPPQPPPVISSSKSTSVTSRTSVSTTSTPPTSTPGPTKSAPKPTEPQTTSQKPTETKSIDPKPTEPKPSDPNSPVPTIVPFIDPFTNPRCLTDSGDSRALVNGTTASHTAEGMTVDKCAETADGWRHFGVEFGGECFWGDELQSIHPASPEQCDMPCSGDPSQLCGGGNRILVYQNNDWKILEKPDIATALEAYARKLWDLREAI